MQLSYRMQTREELYKILQYKPGKEWYYPTQTGEKEEKK
jgi:hypothetical protein